MTTPKEFMTLECHVYGVTRQRNIDQYLWPRKRLNLVKPENADKMEVWLTAPRLYVGKLSAGATSQLDDASILSASISHCEREPDLSCTLRVKIKYRRAIPTPEGWSGRPCSGYKIKHHTRASAQEHLDRLQGSNDDMWWKGQLHIFWCLYCRAYHTGHKRPDLTTNDHAMEQGGRHVLSSILQETPR